METTETYLNPVNKIELINLDISKSYFTEIKMINISDVTPNQTTLDIDCLNRKIKNIGLTDIYILDYAGFKIVLDGHHTIISKKIKGIKKVKAKYLKIN